MLIIIKSNVDNTKKEKYCNEEERLRGIRTHVKVIRKPFR